jgi:curved DNA-binding protein CbpA
VIEVVVADDRAMDRRDGSPAEVRAVSGPSDAVADSLRAEILDRHARLSDLDHYALLGVPRDADAAAIKRAYFGAAKRYHPDALARLGLGDVRSAAEALFARIAKAHAVLSDPRERQRYDEEGRESGSDDAERIVTAESLYRKGEVLLRKGAFREALQFLAPAVDLWPSDAAYRAALGWALYKQTKSDPAAAREHLETAAALDATSAVTFYRLGAVLRALGNAAAADDAFRQARALDPKGSAA